MRPDGRLTIYYGVHLVGRDRGNSGIPRVSRSLAAALRALPRVDVVPVRWCAAQETIVYAEDHFCETMALFDGPAFVHPEKPGAPIDVDVSRAGLLIPEVPHLGSHDARYPSVGICALIGAARMRGLASAVVFHDLLPLTHPHVEQPDAGDVAAFTSYGLAISYADVVFPVSATAAADLRDWWVANGVGRSPRCTVLPTLLPGELKGAKLAEPAAQSHDFVCLGTVCPRKNQVAVMRAFNALIARRPDRETTLHVIGSIAPEVSAQARYEAMASRGRIRLHGFLPDAEAARLIRQARASVFVSLAEGFGLPVAESLALGTPCLCSNTGSIAEIAAGGGCLPVDPTNTAELERTLERLACDDALVERLCGEIAARPARTWADYAADIAGALATRVFSRAPSAEVISLAAVTDRREAARE